MSLSERPLISLFFLNLVDWSIIAESEPDDDPLYARDGDHW